MFQVKALEKIKTHFVFNNFFFENCAVYEIIWKKILYRRAGHMRIARCITNATNTY